MADKGNQANSLEGKPTFNPVSLKPNFEQKSNFTENPQFQRKDQVTEKNHNFTNEKAGFVRNQISSESQF